MPSHSHPSQTPKRRRPGAGGQRRSGEPQRPAGDTWRLSGGRYADQGGLVGMTGLSHAGDLGRSTA